MVLVQVIVDRRDLALSEGIVERVVDLAGGDTKTRCRLPVDLEFDVEAGFLPVGIHVFELGHVLQRCRDLGHPSFQILQAIGLNRVLILRVPLACPDAQILHRGQEQARTRDARELVAQSRDDAVGGDLAFRQRLQVDEDKSAVGLAATA